MGLKILGETHKVTFIDYDGVVLKIDYVEDGKDATPPEENPTRENYTFTGGKEAISKSMMTGQ